LSGYYPGCWDGFFGNKDNSAELDRSRRLLAQSEQDLARVRTAGKDASELVKYWRDAYKKLRGHYLERCDDLEEAHKAFFAYEKAYNEARDFG